MSSSRDWTPDPSHSSICDRGLIVHTDRCEHARYATSHQTSFSTGEFSEFSEPTPPESRSHQLEMRRNATAEAEQSCPLEQ